MSQMVEELLELSALEGEQRALCPTKPVPVVDLLIAVDRLRPLIEDKDINLVFDVPGGHPADPRRRRPTSSTCCATWCTTR